MEANWFPGFDPRIDELHPRVISVFTADGERRLLDDVVRDVLKGE